MWGGPIDTREPHYLDFDDEPEFPRNGKIVVFGGTGFVGQEVVRTAACRGYDVVSVSPSGKKPMYLTEEITKFRAPDKYNYDWADKVTWAEGDAKDPATYAQHLSSSDPNKPFLGVVSCIGAFGNAVEVNGNTNKKLVEECKKAGVPRFCYISAAKYPPPFSLFLGSYYKGKKIAEAAVEEHFPDSGCSIRAPAISGTRWLFGVVPFPMWMPLLVPSILGNIADQWYCKAIGLNKVFQKVMTKEHLGSAACNFVERPTVRFKGVVENYYDIQRLGRSFGTYYA